MMDLGTTVDFCIPLYYTDCNMEIVAHKKTHTHSMCDTWRHISTDLIEIKSLSLQMFRIRTILHRTNLIYHVITDVMLHGNQIGKTTMRIHHFRAHI